MAASPLFTSAHTKYLVIIAKRKVKHEINTQKKCKLEKKNFDIHMCKQFISQ